MVFDPAQQQQEIEARKNAALAALAQGETTAHQGTTDAMTSIQAMQKAALDAELGSARAANAGAPAEAELANIVNRPYASALTSLTTADDRQRKYLWDVGAAHGSYMDKINATLPLIEAQLEAGLVGSGGGGSGGGGGGGHGGGGGGGDDSGLTGDWQKDLSKTFGTTQDLRALGLRDYARHTGDTTVPLFLRARQAASTDFGAPDYALSEIVPTPQYFSQGQAEIQRLAATGGGLARFKRESKQQAQGTQGNQKVQRNYLVAQARQVLPTKAAATKARAKAASKKKK